MLQKCRCLRRHCRAVFRDGEKLGLAYSSAHIAESARSCRGSRWPAVVRNVCHKSCYSSLVENVGYSFSPEHWRCTLSSPKVDYDRTAASVRSAITTTAELLVKLCTVRAIRFFSC